MWDLEYLLLFGLPGNNWELWDGVMHCRFPFRERPAAEAHWELWTRTLCRWQAVDERPGVERKQGTWDAAVGDFSLTLYRQPMNLDVPIDADALEQEAILLSCNGFDARLARGKSCHTTIPI